MLKNDIEKTLQAHKPETPAGFAERSDAQVLQLFAEGKKKGSLKRKFIVVLCGLLLMLSLTTALAATVPGVNAMLYRMWPQAAEALMPINASSVDQGIKLEVESAVLKGDEVLITYSLQDLEGDRINQYTEARLQDDTLFNTDWNYPQATETMQLGFDEAAKKAYFAENYNYGYHVRKPDEHPISFRISYLLPTEATDLHPLLEQYGSAAETTLVENARVFRPSDADGTANESRETVKVLDPARGPNLPIDENVTLTGIGWIDGKLHVQYHFTNLRPYTLPDGFEYYNYIPTVRIVTPPDYSKDGYIVKGITNVGWSSTGEDFPDYGEDIYDCDPEDLKLAEFYFAVTRYDRIMQGNWEVTVPYRMIRSE